MKMTYMKMADGTVFETAHPEYHADCKRLTDKAGKEARRQYCKDELRKMIKPGMRVYCVLRSVSASGMSRRISLFIVQGDDLRNIDQLSADAIGWKVSGIGGIAVSGCGMDMGFHLVYCLGRALFANGFAPSNMAVRPDDGKRINVDIGRGVKHSKEVPFSLDRPAVDKLVAKGWKFEGGRNGDTSGWDNDGGYALRHEWA